MRGNPFGATPLGVVGIDALAEGREVRTVVRRRVDVAKATMTLTTRRVR